MILDTTSKVLRIVLGEAHTTNPCQCVSSWAESAAPDIFNPGNTNINTNGTTPVIVVGAPTKSGRSRDAREVRVYNADTVTHTITMQLFDGSTAWAVAPAVVSVLAGGAFVYTPGSGITVTGPSSTIPSGAAGGDLSGTYPNPTVNTGTTTFSDLVARGANAFTSANVAVGGGPTLSSGNAFNVTNLSLAAGEWLLYGNVGFGNNSTNYSELCAWISTVSATFPTRPNSGAFQQIDTATVAVVQVLSAGFVRMSLGGTTTVYLSGQATYSGGNPVAFGFLGAIPLTART